MDKKLKIKRIITLTKPVTRRLKRFAPKSLLARSLLIIVIPLVLLQITTSMFFYQRHWETVGRRLANTLTGDIAIILKFMDDYPSKEDMNWIVKYARKNMLLKITLHEGKSLKHISKPTEDNIMINALVYALDNSLRLPFIVNISEDKRNINIQLQLKKDVLDITTTSKRLFSSTAYVFVIWMVGMSLLLFAIATLFMRNQVRAVNRLANAAERFGKGDDVENFKPEGATEVRKAAYAFIVMRDRIKKQIETRTQMLAGVSHDLRTPLTRMKLQLAMMSDVDNEDEKEAIEDLKTDISEMEVMLDEYLSFARGEAGEKAINTNIGELVTNIVSKFRRNKKEEGTGSIDLHIEKNMEIPIMPGAFERCLSNIVANSVRYANNVKIRVGEREDNVIDIKNIEITIDDDGEGIPDEKRQEVFKPFIRLEKSRNSQTGGIGLGLSIAQDIMRVHGGDITLEDSPMGGLRVRLFLPI
ncbi:MAG: two-component sensor histidine kinase [Alphaproteobacteria bacterium]|nr:two-component sensor histidine kinase [Alphaproteobacteria bacterium]